ncbi:DUF4440 domain-containing protein [Mangrovihabitans endophyticus]|uniref:DUF4440 domain-containing protein n=1 Tax=Mangrovihabitans endophyticus TaxID=1751298 RepID=A0A8J3FL91_9ACTN|nr:DUF4440 domain-containing protein [Mangrovihabitans endophyticus]GGK76589.1 hypothetical protein GCM10012284_08210 [Mangrovihabitans endophyticus]
MPMDPERRQRYQERAGLTDEQIQQTTGTLTVDRAAAQADGVDLAQVDLARTAVQNIMAECTVISAAYNQIALETERDARDSVDQQDLAADRALLEDSFTKDYRLTDPAGNIGGRDKTMEAIFSGKIRKETFGRGGFETLSDEFMVKGDTAISVGVFRMNATQLARNIKTGETRRRRRTGTFRSTHTYVRSDDRWRLAASQLTLQPDPDNLPGPADAADWVFVDD